MSRKLHVYRMNHDGRHYAVVAAPNAKRAAELLGSSLGGLRSYGGRTDDPKAVAAAMQSPGAVYRKVMHFGPPPEPEYVLYWPAPEPEET